MLVTWRNMKGASMRKTNEIRASGTFLSHAEREAGGREGTIIKKMLEVYRDRYLAESKLSEHSYLIPMSACTEAQTLVRCTPPGPSGNGSNSRKLP